LGTNKGAKKRFNKTTTNGRRKREDGTSRNWRRRRQRWRRRTAANKWMKRKEYLAQELLIMQQKTTLFVRTVSIPFQ
jgi:hypothetical protein